MSQYLYLHPGDFVMGLVIVLIIGGLFWGMQSGDEHGKKNKGEGK